MNEWRKEGRNNENKYTNKQRGEEKDKPQAKDHVTGKAVSHRKALTTSSPAS